MAKASLFSPTIPHFFQPILSGSQSHLNIPVKFFNDHIEGKHEGKTVTLRLDASKKTWKVKMEGQRLTKGWKEFVQAYDLRVGDFVVFRHERNMLFHVTALGPNCCEIQYAPSGCRESDETERSSRSEKQAEENLTAKSNQSSSDLNCFSQTVTASNISRNTVTVPSAFAKQNDLNKGRHKIVLMNEEGRSWPSELKSLVDGRTAIVRGWTSFCTENKLEVGGSCTFELLQNAKTPVFRLCSRSKPVREKETSVVDNIAEKTVEDRFVKLTPTLTGLETGKQHLPTSFTRVNGLVKPGKIILVDKTGAEWAMELMVEKYSGHKYMYIMSRNGWRVFCAINEVGAGDSLVLELIQGGSCPMLKFCSKMEQPPFEVEARAYKRARAQKWSQEASTKFDIREKTAEEGEPSNRTRASNKTSANQGNLHETLPSSIRDEVMTKVKDSVLCSLTSVRRFREELETMEQKLEDSLQDINNLERRRGRDKTTSSSNNQVKT